MPKRHPEAPQVALLELSGRYCPALSMNRTSEAAGRVTCVSRLAPTPLSRSSTTRLRRSRQGGAEFGQYTYFCRPPGAINELVRSKYEVLLELHYYQPEDVPTYDAEETR